MRWSELEAEAPELAAAGRHLLYQLGEGWALLATVAGDAAPRIHPVNVGVVDGGLYTFILPSAKLRDLATDGRAALHAHVDPRSPSEFMIRGRARGVDDDLTREKVAASWPFMVDESYRLYELEIDGALLGQRDDPDEWPPRYRRLGRP